MVTLVEDPEKAGTYLIVGYQEYTDSAALTKDLMSLRENAGRGKIITNLNQAMTHIGVLRQQKAAPEPVEEELGEFSALVKGTIAKWEADFDRLVGQYDWAVMLLKAINGRFTYGPANLHMVLFLHHSAAPAAELIYSVAEGKREELARELIAALPTRVQTGGSTFPAEAPAEFAALGAEYVINTFGEVARKVAELHPAPAGTSQFAALARRVFDHTKGYSWTVIFMERFVKDWPKIVSGQLIGATEVVGDWLRSSYNDHPLTGKWMGKNVAPAEIFAAENSGYGNAEVQQIASLLYLVLQEREQLGHGAMVSYADGQRAAVTAVLTPALGARLAGAVAGELVVEATKNATIV